MADSTQRAGKCTIPSAARLSVMECATVNAVTIFSTLASAGRAAATGSHLFLSRRKTPGSSNASRKRI